MAKVVAKSVEYRDFVSSEKRSKMRDLLESQKFLIIKGVPYAERVGQSLEEIKFD